MKGGICPKCDARDVVGNIGEPRGLFSPWGVSPPGNWPSKTYVEVRVWVCGQCGYTELYTHNASKITNAIDKGADVAKRCRMQYGPVRVSPTDETT